MSDGSCRVFADSSVSLSSGIGSGGALSSGVGGVMFLPYDRAGVSNYAVPVIHIPDDYRQPAMTDDQGQFEDSLFSSNTDDADEPETTLTPITPAPPPAAEFEKAGPDAQTTSPPKARVTTSALHGRTLDNTSIPAAPLSAPSTAAPTAQAPAANAPAAPKKAYLPFLR